MHTLERKYRYAKPLYVIECVGVVYLTERVGVVSVIECVRIVALLKSSISDNFLETC